MYKLGEQFELDYDQAKSNPKAVFQGEKYRITVLTESLIRLEYNSNGIFEDRPTELVHKRNFEEPKINAQQDQYFLEITTDFFKLYYKKEKNFYAGRIYPTANLSIMSSESERIWYYKHPEVRNYGAPNDILIDKKNKYQFVKGLYSLDGFVSIDDSKSDIIDQGGFLIEREDAAIDIYVFVYGKNYQKCLQDYFAITGKPALIPRFALGNWWSKKDDYNDNKLRNLIDRFEHDQIPLSVLVLNESWHVNQYNDLSDLKSGFVFNQNNFKNPPTMIKYLHSKGIRIGLSINPIEGIYPYETNYSEIANHIKPDEKGRIPFDVFDVKTIDAYFKLLIHYLDAMHIDFYWLDIEKKGLKKEKFILNHYHFNDMKRNYKRRPMIVAENTNVAPHRYPVLYTRETQVDWKTLKAIPFFNASASNNGVTWWAHDIGGSSGGIEEDELFIRYVQLGTFSPILKLGSEKGIFYKRAPWLWDTNTYNITKEFLRLRHRLIPYLYSEAYKYHKEGKPLLEPIYYKYPEMYDDQLYRNEYYFGSQLFVCPIIKKKEEIMKRAIQHFYMPEGVWYDFFTGKRFPGPDNYVSFFKEQQYPVFAKAGSIIPFGENDNIFDTTPPKHMEIHVFPGRSNSYELYEDDGMTDLHRKGFFLKTLLEYNYLPNNYTLIIRPSDGKSGIVPEKRNYRIRFRNTKRAKDVTAYIKNEQVECRTYVSSNDFVVEVKDVPTVSQLTINCKGKDIEIDALHIINDDIFGIITDLFIETDLKQKVYEILFSDLSIKKKRIEVRRLKRKGLEPKFIKLFLKLLEYVELV